MPSSRTCKIARFRTDFFQLSSICRIGRKMSKVRDKSHDPSETDTGTGWWKPGLRVPPTASSSISILRTQRVNRPARGQESTVSSLGGSRRRERLERAAGATGEICEVITEHTFVTFRTNDLRKAIPMVGAPPQAINVSRYDLTGETQCS